MARTDDLFGLENFARAFLQGIDHHRDVRTERLAEAFRRWFRLTPFPTLAELYDVCSRLGIHIRENPRLPLALHGLNAWPKGQAPAIYLREDLDIGRAETTLAHELREVIEHAFRRVKPTYVGLDPRDNRAMNFESDQFAGCLLMAADATRDRLEEIGFDLPRFAAERNRSLPSVLLRAQLLFPAGGEHEGPVAGYWLFEAPWGRVQAGESTPDDLVCTLTAKLCGFSTSAKGRCVEARVFPSRRARATSFALPTLALARRKPVAAFVGGFDLFGEQDFFAAAEPFFARGLPWRVLLAVVRNDSLDLVCPWLWRLEFQEDFDVIGPLFQQL